MFASQLKSPTTKNLQIIRSLTSTVHAFKKGEKVYLADQNNKTLSFWDNVELRVPEYAEDEFNMVVEIPKGTLKKVEMKKDEDHHPLVQEFIKDKRSSGRTVPRYYPLFTTFSYGFLPQTYEDPEEIKYGLLVINFLYRETEIRLTSWKFQTRKSTKQEMWSELE